MDGTLAQIITDLMQSQQVLARLQTQLEAVAKERDELRAQLAHPMEGDNVRG